MRTARSSSRLLGEVSASVHARIQPPGPGPPPPCGPQDPLPWVWAWRPPWPDPPNFPPRCGLGDSPQPDPNFPPRCGSGDPPPMDRILHTRFWKYYLAPTEICPPLVNRSSISEVLTESQYFYSFYNRTPKTTSTIAEFCFGNILKHVKLRVGFCCKKYQVKWSCAQKASGSEHACMRTSRNACLEKPLIVHTKNKYTLNPSLWKLYTKTAEWF